MAAAAAAEAEVPELNVQQQQQLSDIIPGLPFEISLLCLARLPLSSRPFASSVCRSWRLALSLPALDRIRRDLRISEHRLFACAPPRIGLLSKKSHQFFSLDPRFLRSIPLSPPPHTRGYPHGFHCGLVAMGRCVLVARIRRDKTLNVDAEDNLCFDLASNRWCHLPPPMNIPRACFATACVGGYAYAAGGCAGSEFVRSVERYDLGRREWERISDMNEERFMAWGIEWKGSFCVIGGCRAATEGDGGGAFERSDSAEVWDAGAGQWELIPGIWPDGMWKPAVVRGNLYCIKGYKKIMRLDESSLLWRCVGCPPLELQGAHEYDLLGVGDELWMLISEHGRRRCKLFAGAPNQLPISWRSLPFSFEYYPTNVCVATI